MRIAWFCIPAHGHTNPTLGIVRELTRAGHQVYYFSFEMFREKIHNVIFDVLIELFSFHYILLVLYIIRRKLWILHLLSICR